jgi:hypothetical protein
MAFFDDGDTCADSDGEGDDDDASVIIATAVCHDTWLPKILLAVPIQEYEPDSETGLPQDTEGCAVAFVSPEEAYQIGASIIAQAGHAASLHRVLVKKPIEERKEIIALEAQYSGICDPE